MTSNNDKNNLLKRQKGKAKQCKQKQSKKGNEYYIMIEGNERQKCSDHWRQKKKEEKKKTTIKQIKSN